MNLKLFSQTSMRQPAIRRVTGPLLVLLLLLALTGVRPAYAASITVDTTADVAAEDGACSLREAIANANSDSALFTMAGECPAGSGADTIMVPDGTYTLDSGEGELIITSNINIIGNSADGTVIQADACDPTGPSACTHTHRVFSVTGPGTTASFSGLGIQYGRVTGSDGGGIAVIDADVTISNSVISFNRVEDGQGGGIYANRPVSITNSAISYNQALYDNDANPVLGYGGGLYMSGGQLDNVSVDNNKAGYAGGGIFNNGGTLTVQNGSRVNNNDSAGWGGGLHNLGGSLIVQDSQVRLNTSGRGGGIYNANTAANDATVSFTGNSSVDGNWAAFFGGGIFNRRAFTETQATVTLQDDSQVSGNQSDGDGGGVYNWGFSIADPGYGAALHLMDRSQITGNSGVNGGGIYLYQNSTITAGGGEISFNTAQGKGGGVYVRDGFINAANSSVMNNSATGNAGGLYLERGEATLSDTGLNENQSGGFAGGIYIDAGSMHISGGSIDQNQSNNAGGGVVVSNGSLSLTGTGVSNNLSLTGHGGGIWNDAGTVTLTEAVIAQNQAQSNGGGMQNSSGELVVNGGEFTGNTAVDFFGGALYNVSGKASFTGTLISGNQAVGGGAIRNQEGTATLDILQSQIVDNTATSGNGGALLLINGQTQIEQTTLAYNSASGTGGAMRANNGSVLLTNSTVSGNNAGGGGGAIYVTNATVGVSSSTLANNGTAALSQLSTGTGAILIANSIIASIDGISNCAAGLNLVSTGYNLASDSTCNLTATGDTTHTDPMIFPLADNGGPTLTHALQDGSPAIDAAPTGPATDQRGVARPQGAGFDIGAFEVEVMLDSTPPVITPNVTGTLGDNGWYISDVTVTWTVSDDESAITTSSGCDSTTIDSDTAALTLTCEATSDGGTNSVSVTIKRDATPPVVNVTGVADGATYALGSVPTAGCDTSDALSGVATSASLTLSGGNPDGTGTFTATCDGALDNAGSSGSASVTYTVEDSNQAPIANPGGPYMGAVNTSVQFDGSGSSDPDGDSLTYAWDFGDGSDGSGDMPTHTYTATGIYNVCLTVNDGTVDSDPACTIAVIYDPSGGFVTGGGWINSPAGAYKPDESLAGKATFGFVSKYKKGASVPTGTTAFAFDLAGFEFHSDSYEWLVVNQGGTNAQFKGSGTVNAGLDPNGNPFKFMLWAGDGNPDTFRIRIWWEDNGAETVVYDNGIDQPIGGGNIVVHKAK